MTRGRVVRYAFTVMDLHNLLLACLPADYINFRFLRVYRVHMCTECSTRWSTLIP
jgi:hypothetical protein